VIYDGPKEMIGKSFVHAARRIGAKVDVFRLRKNRFSDQTLNSLSKKISTGKYHLFVNMIEGRGEEIQARSILMKSQMAAQQEKGGAIAHCPAFEEIMLRLEVDYPEMNRTTNRVRRSLTGGSKVSILTQLGTNLRFSILGREIHDDVLPKKHDWSNFPCGEVFCAPIEETANGVLIADGSVGGSFIGLLPQPLRFKIVNGRIASMRWLNNPAADSKLLKKIREALFQDEGASVLCELGIGVAPYPISGILLQDEKVAGHIHIAFGMNDFFGGANKSESHIDFLVKKPEVKVNYFGRKPSQIILCEGKLEV
jgi:leucyl aminopeptidase (aminopeptidase T)